jgi:hypothetical protein
MLTDLHDLLALPPPQTTLLRIPRRRHFALLHVLQSLRSSRTERHLMERQSINPDYPRQETVVERVACIEPNLFTCFLSG